MSRLIAFLLVLLCPLAAQAQRRNIRTCAAFPPLLKNVALNGSAASRTFELPDISGYDQARIDVQFTHANDGALTVTCTGKSAEAVGDATITREDTTLTTCTVASGTCTLNFSGVWVTSTLTADKDYSFPFGLSVQDKVFCVISHGGTPAAGDTVIVTGKKCVVGK